MSPETGPQDIPFDETVEVIKNELIVVQQELEDSARIRRAELLPGVRTRLNFPPPETADISDLVNTRIRGGDIVISPEVLDMALPVSPYSAQTTREGRKNFESIFTGEDDRLFVAARQCSVHKPLATYEFSKHTRKWRIKYKDTLDINGGAHLEKPRTEKDWPGYIYDPKLDGSEDINHGLVGARILTLWITRMGVPLVTERLNALTPQYFNALIAYDVLGARNAEDQKGREYMSGTSSGAGMKNSTDGSIKKALQGVITAMAPHSILGMTQSGTPWNPKTTGNETAHVVLRGGPDGPNYSAENIEELLQMIDEENEKIERRNKEKSPDEQEPQLLRAVGIDTSHDNTKDPEDPLRAKNYLRQVDVAEDIAVQMAAGQTAIKMVMIESNLVGGKQPFVHKKTNPKDLLDDQSITDPCVDLIQTENILDILSEGVLKRREYIAKQRTQARGKSKRRKRG